MSFAIKNQNNGFLFSVYFQAEPTRANDLKKDFEKNKDILRFLLISKKPEKQTAPKQERKPKTISETDETSSDPKPRQTEPTLEQIEEDLDKILE